MENGKTVIIDDMLSSYLIRATLEIDRDWCISVFSDNAGIIEFDENYGVSFKVETHNHPSAIGPYGGAGTGLGGVIRDTLGVGLGAKPILNTDVFCFGLHDMSYKDLPKGVLHPRRVFIGVAAGVRDYGNRMGIPTSNGAIFFDKRYTGNPLVYCGNVGLIPIDKCQKEVHPGDIIVVIGGRTGIDGIHGVTFASAELDDDSEEMSSGAVQIGNPIMQQNLIKMLLYARDKGLYDATTDCGGGGLSSSIGEMGEHTGARVYLDKVLLKYTGLAPWQIWVSEAQERMVLSVPPEKLAELLQLFKNEGVEATVVGEFTDDGRLHLLYNDATVADLSMKFMHKGCPRVIKKAVWKQPVHQEPSFDNHSSDLTPSLEAILSSPNVASKEWVIRQYDHEVQGGSVLKPLQGVNNDGPGDACITRPLLDSNRGIIVANGMNPLYGDIDTYHMAASAIDEALRNLISVGGNLSHTALLDNFSWGNPDKPDRLGALVRAVQACYDIAVIYGTPFISGKDSLYNEYSDSTTGESISIPPTLLISAICVMPDIRKAVSMDAKSAGDTIYIVGKTYDEMGGSHYYHINGFVGNSVPVVRPQGKENMEKLSQAISQGIVRACHDCSEGGIGVAAAEMAFAGGCGMNLHMKYVPISDDVGRNDTVLFSESNSRFIVEVSEASRVKFEQVMQGTSVAAIGEIVNDENFVVYGVSGESIVSAKISELKEAWQSTFKDL